MSNVAEQYETKVTITEAGDFDIGFSGIKGGQTVTSNITGNLSTVEVVPAQITQARDLFATAEAEAAKVLEG